MVSKGSIPLVPAIVYPSHNNLSDESISKAVAEASSVSDTLRLLKRAKVGSNFKLVLETVGRLGLDTSHWKAYRPQKILSSASVLVEHGRHSRKVVKALVLRYGLLPYRCQSCNLGPTWNGKPLTLRLDHKNGVRDDDRLENLRFLCPNCDSQTATFCGRNRTPGANKKHPCLDCPALTFGQRCRPCASRHQHVMSPQLTKISWPSISDLRLAVAESNILATAKKLGVSDNALRKRLRRSSS